jgi:hypothetical protein
MRDEEVQVLEVLTQVLRLPFQIVQEVVSHEWTFAVNHCPTQVESHEEPPIRLGNHLDVIPIDGVLGQYNPAKQQITIFRKGIQRVAETLNMREDDLTFVVQLHEWAHALVHIGLLEDDRLRVTRDDSLWPRCLEEATSIYEGLDPELHEPLAQLLTFHGLQNIQAAATVPEAKAALARIYGTFKDLMQRAPREYQINDYVQVPKHRIVQSMKLLKNQALNGFYAWDIVVRW